MPTVDVVVSVSPSKSARAAQISGMFDLPVKEKLSHQWSFDAPFDDEPWQIGLIVGPSGAGKSTIGKNLFGDPSILEWSGDSVIDDFEKGVGIRDIAKACQSVGFNTIPSWLKPYSVLSTGEQFRVSMARLLLSSASPIVVDEFTSVIDRQVAQIASHSVQKYIRQTEKKFVAISCHYDIVEWLQPDWIIEPHLSKFDRRCHRQRPKLPIEVCEVDREAWKMFAPFHYMSASLNKAAKCFVLFVDGKPASFAGIIHFPHPKTKNLKRVSRLVTLPDFQGLGLSFALLEVLGREYKKQGYRLRTYPAHPSLIKSFDRSNQWKMKARPSNPSKRLGKTSKKPPSIFRQSMCAVFEFCED